MTFLRGCAVKRGPFFLPVNHQRHFARYAEDKNKLSMKFINLEYIKEHSRIDFDCEDSLLELYGEAAEETILNICNRSLDDIMQVYGRVPSPLKQAAIMLVDVSYNHRSPVEPNSISNVPYSFDLLIKPYMRL